MRLSSEEKSVRREIDAWKRERAPLVSQAFDCAMKPVDWAAERAVPPEAVDRAEEAVRDVLSTLSDASEWTYEADDLLDRARERDLSDVQDVTDLRHHALDDLDPLARSFFDQNTLLAALEGGSTGLGGGLLLAADVPLLFTIGFRLIQQIGAAYGFPMRGPEARPLVLSVFNVAASGGGREAKADALREVSVAASSFAGGQPYRGRVTGTFRDQNRHLPREIAKNLIGRKLGQAVPGAGAAVGAGVNYWFTRQTAEAAFMLFRALYLDWKERR
ncbi:MAG: EcsC family protein [Bacteroidetes bacterium QH_2_67_10]|nr:MAG: EcsC family protein [Bacteroidetes bacterium QH_2_67_10]